MPTRGLINPELLTDIADAIRAKNGTSAGMTPAQMAAAISNLELSEAIKQALLNCFAHVAWIDDQGQSYYDALEDALYPTAPPAELLSISAVFEQGQTVIYDTDSLDDLKPMLTVTANYSDSTSAVVVGYTLSGTLTAGTSTITVSYGGKTTTFDVTVTAYPALWETTNQSFDGGNVVTNVVLCDEDRDWTIAYDVTLDTNPSTNGGNASTYRLFRILNAAGIRYAVSLSKAAYNSTKYTFGYMQDGTESTMLEIGTVGTGRQRIVATHEKNSGVANISIRKDNGAVETGSITAVFESSSAGLVFGQSSGTNQLPKGTLNDVSVWDIVWDNDRINDFLGV